MCIAILRHVYVPSSHLCRAVKIADIGSKRERAQVRRSSLIIKISLRRFLLLDRDWDWRVNFSRATKGAFGETLFASFYLRFTYNK